MLLYRMMVADRVNGPEKSIIVRDAPKKANGDDNRSKKRAPHYSSLSQPKLHLKSLLRATVANRSVCPDVPVYPLSDGASTASACNGAVEAKTERTLGNGDWQRLRKRETRPLRQILVDRATGRNRCLSASRRPRADRRQDKVRIKVTLLVCPPWLVSFNLPVN